MLLCGVLLLPVVVVIHSVLAVFAIVGVPSVVDIPNMADIPSDFSTVVSDLMLLGSPAVVDIFSDPVVENVSVSLGQMLHQIKLGLVSRT